MEAADFSGYATKAGLKCSDGRTITPEAFKHMDGMRVPLVWQHGHHDPKNVLGHAVLEARDDGMYAYGFFNETDQGQNANLLVQHEDIKSLSIFANQLKETVVRGSKNVIHGIIREVSLVLAGANPGALIDQVRLAHSDGEIETLEDEAVIFTGLELEHSAVVSESESEVEVEADTEDEDVELEHVDNNSEKTAREIFNEFTNEQKDVVHYMIGAALDSANTPVKHGENVTNDDVLNTMTDVQQQVVHSMIGAALEAAADKNAANSEGNLTHQEGNDTMSRNVFDQSSTTAPKGPVLSHADVTSIFQAAQQPGQTFQSALKHFAENSEELKHSITNLEVLFPDAKTLTDQPEWITRRMEWVSVVLNGTKHSPFAKIKTILADITADEARAKGYVKGNLKTEEVLTLLRRTTGPATIYKKQKLDRDDIIDITDIDIVMWLKAEMRLMIEEEVARAILVGDGRSTLSPDKIKDPSGSIDGVGIRSILNDDPLYALRFDLAANVSAKDAVKGLVRARSNYRGTGKPTLFISDAFLTDIMLEEDKFGRALYETEQSLKDKLRVSNIVTIDLFDEYNDLFAIMVSLADYTIGANRGGELTSFEDFDIDYNQHKYLQETRLSGGLTKPYSAVVIRRSVGILVVATAPSFDGTTDTITIPTVTGVTYYINDVAQADGASVVITGPTEVVAMADDGYYLAANTTRSWTYTV